MHSQAGIRTPHANIYNALDYEPECQFTLFAIYHSPLCFWIISFRLQHLSSINVFGGFRSSDFVTLREEQSHQDCIQYASRHMSRRVITSCRAQPRSSIKARYVPVMLRTDVLACWAQGTGWQPHHGNSANPQTPCRPHRGCPVLQVLY